MRSICPRFELKLRGRGIAAPVTRSARLSICLCFLHPSCPPNRPKCLAVSSETPPTILLSFSNLIFSSVKSQGPLKLSSGACDLARHR
ncbi:hypothetical protein SCHPADRAFT_612297 [Schizopora paradoxa]|uniref:Uncharacterized protein n=1 Tax=Schizopora paradoxa TaxID=27342 RepID=A0A0H2R915_9AGAM|nr:hypothetical protein SCHPADRAFT_612297 [Schizopora paradoxa]